MTELVIATPQSPAQVIAQHSKSFALASRLLPPQAREDAVVLYAWCRGVDDAVDGGGVVDATSVIARLGGDVESAYERRTADPLLAAFGEVCARRAIPRVYPDELISGMAMDLGDTRYSTFEDLFVYAHRVAGVVGLMMAHVLGISDPDALASAAHLGIGMQLTNICRDVAEDWARGRVYIPADMLPQRLAPTGPLPDAAVFAPAIRELLAIADRYYASADRGIRALPWRAGIAVRSARDIYSAIGREIARRDHDVTAGRAIVGKPAKLAKVAGAFARLAATAPARWFDGRRHAPPDRILELADVPRL